MPSGKLRLRLPFPIPIEPFVVLALPLGKMLVMDKREELPVLAAKTGDATAWEQLFRRYRLPVYVYAFELLRNKQDAFDTVQETFLNATRYLTTEGNGRFHVASEVQITNRTKLSHRHGRLFFQTLSSLSSQGPKSGRSKTIEKDGVGFGRIDNGLFPIVVYWRFQ